MSDLGPARHTLGFGVFQCDIYAGELRKNGARVRLADQLFRLLAILLERPGELVTRQELQQRLWPDQSFGDFNDGLNTAINKLRAALDDKAEKPRYIETVPRRGYRFIGKVEPAEPQGAPAAEQRSGWLGRRSRAGLTVAATVLLALLAAGLVLYFAKRPVHARAAQVSLLVLPFRNLTGNPANDYLADGLTQELITRFARDYGGELRVIARDSALSLKGSRNSLSGIAASLGVEYVIQGSVRREGRHIRVAAQLMRASDQSSLWADSYDGDSSRLLEFEGSVASSVARQLSLRVPAVHGPPYVPRTDAHDDYLRGLYFLSKRTKAGLDQALEHFAEATVSDPHYARAYAELAVTYNLMGEYTWINPREARSLGKAAAEQAIADDPSLAEAHAALGFSDWFYGWNRAAAGRELRRAIQLDPNNPDAHHWYAQVLMTEGRFAEAEQQMGDALRFDPASLILRTNLGWLHYFERRYPLAIAEMKSVVHDDPGFLTAHYKLWEAYSVAGDRADAWKECRQLVSDVSSPENERKIVSAYRQGGYASALEKFGSLDDKNYYGSDVDQARCLIFAGDKARALALLERAYRARDGWMIFVPVDPAFDSLRANAHFAHLTLELRLPSPPST